VRPPYPLSALVGQELLVQALLVNAVCPEVGGVLIRGERGSAKSTAVRALAPLLPPVEAASSLPFPYAPGERGPFGPVADGPTELRPAALVELPLGATLDRLLGAIDLKEAVAGRVVFEPGLLARAHRGILYVDEVNLLPDHLVDALLDAAASGVARIEREGVSVEHDARFLLVGTMNVEEGELRPQLSDRFGLCVEVEAPRSPQLRAEIVRRRLAYAADPQAFAARYAQAERQLGQRIAAARARLAAVALPDPVLERIAALCAELEVEGVRGDLATATAAQALAALAEKEEVGEEEVERAALLALPHRLRSDPLAEAGEPLARIEAALQGRQVEEEPPQRDGSDRHTDGGGVTEAERSNLAAPARPHTPKPLGPPLRYASLLPRAGGRDPGRSLRGASQPIDSRPHAGGPVAVLPSLRARAFNLESPREAIERGRSGALLCLVVDASGSMGARRRLARVKGALLGLLREAYVRRDRVALIAFAGRGPKLLCPPGTPPERVARAVAQLPAGGGTPLAEGLALAERVVRGERLRRGAGTALAFLFSDGRTRRPQLALAAVRRLGAAVERLVVVDGERGPVRLGIAPLLAQAAGALYIPEGGR